MKITIEIKKPEYKKELFWLFHRLQEVNEGTGVHIKAKHNSGEVNEYYFDGDGGERVHVEITGI